MNGNVIFCISLKCTEIDQNAEGECYGLAMVKLIFANFILEVFALVIHCSLI